MAVFISSITAREVGALFHQMSELDEVVVGLGRPETEIPYVINPEAALRLIGFLIKDAERRVKEERQKYYDENTAYVGLKNLARVWLLPVAASGNQAVKDFLDYAHLGS